MKKLFLIVFVCAALCSTKAFSQFSITDADQNVITNTTVELNYTSDAASAEFYFYVKNTSSSSIADIKATLELVSGALPTPIFCSGAVCGMPNLSSPKFTLASNQQGEVHLALSNITENSLLKMTVAANGATSAIFYINLTQTTDIENSYAQSFNVYPSPANESFTIENNFGKNTYVEIYNVLGQVVKKVNPTSGTRVIVDCGSWKNGYYVCRAYKNGKIEKTVKVVVTH